MEKIRITMRKAKGQLQPGRSYNLDRTIAEALIQSGHAEAPKHPEPIGPKETPAAGPSEFKQENEVPVKPRRRKKNA